MLNMSAESFIEPFPTKNKAKSTLITIPTRTTTIRGVIELRVAAKNTSTQSVVKLLILTSPIIRKY